MKAALIIMRLQLALFVATAALFGQSARTTNYKPNIPGVANGVNVEDMLLAGRPNVIAFAGADPTGIADSTAAIQACVNYGEQIGAPCYLPMIVKAIGRPAAMYRIATFVTLPAATTDIQLMGLVGDGSTQIAQPTYPGRGTQIYCSATYGTTGDRTQGCIRYDAVTFALPTFIFENLTFRGPDTPYTTTTSGDAIRIDDHGISTGRIHMRNVLAQYFLGTDTAAYWFDGPEDNTIDTVSAVYVNSCSVFRGAFNDTVVTNFNCAQYVQDGSYVEGSENVHFVGGGWQSGQHTGIHLRGVINSTWDDPHLEGNNTSCVAPLQALWGTTPIVSAAAALGATSVSLSGLGTGSIPSGSTVAINVPGFVAALYTTVGTAAISGGAATLTLTSPLPNAVTVGSTIATPCTNGDANVVIEGGYTGLGCDSHGRYCGYNGGFNETVAFDHPVFNSVFGIGSAQALIAFSNPVGSNGVNYVDVGVAIKDPNTGGIQSPFATIGINQFSFSIGQTRAQSLDLGFPGTGNCFAIPALDDCPSRQTIVGPITVNGANAVGNNNVFTAQDTALNPQQMLILNHYVNPGVANAAIWVGTNTGPNGTLTIPMTFDLFNDCVVQGSTACSGTYKFNTASLNTTDLYVNGNHSIDSGNIGRFAAGSTVGGVGIAKTGVATNATTPAITCTSTSSAVPVGGGTPTITTTCTQASHTHTQN
jgi:hypothetical protein